jgi:hypothetical protein
MSESGQAKLAEESDFKKFENIEYPFCSVRKLFILKVFNSQEFYFPQRISINTRK